MPRTSRCWRRSSGYEEARRGNASDVAVRCTTFDHTEAHITLRIPREWAHALERRAKERGATKSQLVLEALRQYLAVGGEEEKRAGLRERLQTYVGVARLDRAAIEADPLARQIYEHNWRE